MATTSVRTLLMIRVAMIAGIVAFAVIVFVLKRSALLVSVRPEGALDALRMATWVAAAASAAVLLALRTRLGSIALERRATITIVAWAVGEFAALFGLAFYMLSGIESAAAPGLIAFSTAMVLFPATGRE